VLIVVRSSSDNRIGLECLLIRYIIHEKPYKSSYLWDTTLAEYRD